MESLGRVFSRIGEITNTINAMNQFGNFQKKVENLKTESSGIQANALQISQNEEIDAVEKSFSKKLNSKFSDLEKAKNKLKNEELKEGSPYKDIIHSASKKYGISPFLINSVIKQESNYDPYAVSDKGALGLMQLLPSTAKEMGVEHVFSPKDNIEGGSKYLSQLLNAYGGDLVKALAAYNAGSANVDNKRAFNFDETNLYVKKVISNYMKNIGG